MDKRNFIPILQIEDKREKIYLLSSEIDKLYRLGILDVMSGSGEWTEQLREKVPENFCLYPFINFQLDPDGRARPCCKYKVGDSSWQINVPRLPDVDIGELWNQTEFQLLRDQFLRNERPSGCKACWDEEAAGIKSMRIQREGAGRDHPYATFFFHVPRTYPKTLDLKLSNLCNLKCRICTPFLSSQWIKETKDLNITDMGSQESFTNNSREKFSENEQNKQVLKQWAPTIDHLEFYGGEPLMQQEHDDILNIIHEHGNPSRTGLYYNTNATICDEKFFKLWALFAKVIINFSIDDICERFEYQRKNAKWDEVLQNIALYKEFGKKYNVNLELRIYTTVGILNVFYLKEFFTFMTSLDLTVTLNLVHYPYHFSIINLPAEVKEIVKNKLLSIGSDYKLYEHSATIDNIINFMYGTEPDQKLLNTFFNKLKLHDRYRNEDYAKTFPEFYEIIQKYE